MDPKGPVGAAERVILLDSLAIMLAIIVPTMVATLAFAWWYRASNARARRQPDFAYSGRLEAIVWAIPALVVLFLGGIAWVGAHALDPAKRLPASPAAGKALEVQVVSLDWKWLFIYPDQGVATVNRLVLPAGEPVHFTLTSATVMNSFFVPQLGSQIYTMAGMATQLNLQADRPGTYAGQSSHFSGDGFAGMRFTVDARTPRDFAAWAAGARGRGPALDRQGYAALARESRDVTPFGYGAVVPGLFDAVVRQTAPEAESPMGRPNADISPHSTPPSAPRRGA